MFLRTLVISVLSLGAAAWAEPSSYIVLETSANYGRHTVFIQSQPDGSAKVFDLKATAISGRYPSINYRNDVRTGKIANFADFQKNLGLTEINPNADETNRLCQGWPILTVESPTLTWENAHMDGGCCQFWTGTGKRVNATTAEQKKFRFAIQQMNAASIQARNPGTKKEFDAVCELRYQDSLKRQQAFQPALKNRALTGVTPGQLGHHNAPVGK